MWLRTMLIDNAKAMIPFAGTLRAIKRSLAPWY